MLKLLTVRFWEKAILTIVVLLGSKYITVLALNLALSLNWKVDFSPSQIFSLPFVHYSDQLDLILVNSVATLVTALVLVIGFTLTLFRFQFFHNNFILPKVASKLHTNKMEWLILDEKEAHSEIVVWSFSSWLVFIIGLLKFLGGSIDILVLGFTFIVVILLNTVLVVDMNRKASLRVSNK